MGLSSGVADQASDGSNRAGESLWTGASRVTDTLTPELVALLAAVTATAAGVAIGVAPAPALAVAVLCPAALVDLRERRLPDRWVLAAAAVLAAVSTIAALVGDPPGVAPLAAGATVVAGPLLVLHLVSPRAMGFGDVKVAIVLGAALGWVDWRLGLVALSIATAAAATVGIVRRLDTIAFGPFLVAATALALLASDTALAPLGTHR